MPRFVILEHDHPELHWDLMLEAGTVLRTWRLTRAPESAGEIIEAVAIGDHRLEYLDYEGPITGGRGNVQRWDGGEYSEIESGDANGWRLVLSGSRIRGLVQLAPIADSTWAFTRLDYGRSR